MFERKCPGCAKKVERSFNFCPHCGKSFKAIAEKRNYGVIGRDDSGNLTPVAEEMKLPFGMEKLVNSLVKQLENEMNKTSTANRRVPAGIKIRISTGPGKNFALLDDENKDGKRANFFGNLNSGQIVQEEEPRREIVEKISEEEIIRRSKLPKIEAESTIKRLGDRVVYEIKVPGVKNKRDIVITTLESGVEIRAYSGKSCYVKEIPMMIEIIRYSLRDEKIFLEIRT